MPNFTRKAIMESCLKLLNERPVKQIKVKDIVDDCGINRNSFYYHFTDLPTLIESMITEEADRIIEEYPSFDSIEDCLHVAIGFAMDNKKAALHIYNSANRDIFEQHLWTVCEHVINMFIDTAMSNITVSADERKVLVSYYKCQCFGQVIDWMNSSMSYDIEDMFHKLIVLRREMGEREKY